MMKLLTKAQKTKMSSNGLLAASHCEKDFDFFPVVKFFCPWGNATWLLTELDPRDTDIAFGLCDLGLGSPELGTVSLNELSEIRGPAGLGIERDRYFNAKAGLETYIDQARTDGYISA